MKKPLAYRMRPKYLNDVIGQLDLVGPTGFLTNCLLFSKYSSNATNTLE